MLKKEIRLFIIVVIFLLYACQNDKGKAKQSTNKYVAEHFGTYQPIYNQITNCIKVCLDSMVSSYSTEYYDEWHVDSLLCINSESDKLVTTVNQSSGVGSNAGSDQIEKLLAKKINGKWYVFKAGEALTVPRDFYGRDSLHPINFYELSQIARKEFLEGALKEQADGSYEVNDEFIDYHFYNGYGGTERTKEQKDSIHWTLIRGQWKYRIDTNEYKPLRKHKYNL